MLKTVSLLVIISTAVAVPVGAQLGPVAAVGGSTPQARGVGPLKLEMLAHLDNPFGVAVLPDGSVLVTEKSGHLRLFKNGQLSDPIPGIPSVVFRGQGGLLDVVLSPGFVSNHMIYFTFTEAAADQPGGTDPCDTRLGPFCEKDDNVYKGTAVARAKFEANTLTDTRVIWSASPKTRGRNHYGGRMAFAKDGTLYVTVGDRQRFDPAQDKAVDLGKIVHLTADGAPAPGNPFASAGGPAKDIWTLGHRNPTGIVINPAGQVWVGEMGPMGGDEINLIERGKNYGWPLVSEGDNYDATPIARPLTRPDLERAKTYWNPSISPSGLMLYSGNLFSGWTGSLLAGGLSSQAIVRVVPGADGIHDMEIIPVGFRVRALVEAGDGSIYVLRDGDDGALLRLTPLSPKV